MATTYGKALLALGFAGLVFGCGEANSAGDGAGSETAEETSSDSSEAESSSSAETSEQSAAPVGDCPFASEEAVNQVYKNILGGEPLAVDRVEKDECVWANGFAVSVSVKRVPLSDAKDPSRDKYNLDIEPEITELDGPGSNAVMLSDEVLQGPYAFYFEKDGMQYRIRLLGLISTPEKMVALANEVAK